MRVPLGHLKMVKYILRVTNINMCSTKMAPMKEHVSYSVIGVNNYDAERWDALTDGMEGDYPGSGVDYDLLGF